MPSRMISRWSSGCLFSSAVKGLMEPLKSLTLKSARPRFICSPGKRGIQRERVAVVGDGFVVALLAGFDQAEMRERLRVVRIAAGYALPGLLGFGVPSLLLQREGVLAGVVLS